MSAPSTTGEPPAGEHGGGRPLLLDAKVIPAWDPSIFRRMQRAGLSAVGVVCSTWDDHETAMRNLRGLRRFVLDDSDALLPVEGVEDVLRAHREGRVGVIAAWQNCTGFDERLDTVAIAREAGLRVAQPTFVGRSPAGCGSDVEEDTGLTSYGRDLLATLEEQRIAVDLSHVGHRTTEEVLERARRPPFFSQAAPAALRPTRRNKPDELLHGVAEAGGVVCIATLKVHLPGTDPGLDAMADAVEHVLGVVGEDAVAIGTDLIPGQGVEFLEHVSREGGTGRLLMDYDVAPNIRGFDDFHGYAALSQELGRRGHPERNVDKLMGRNLLRYYGRVWGAPTAPHAPAER